MSMREECLFCGEIIALTDPPAIPVYAISNTGADPVRRYVHRECQLREVMGGIGHLIAHEYWCLERQDPDAGLTFRQSSKLVDAYVHLVGVPDAQAT